MACRPVRPQLRGRGGGFVRRPTVVMAEPGDEIDRRGAMGPVMTRGIDGDPSFTFMAAHGGTDVTMTNDVGGHMSEDFASGAPKADAMLADLPSRLKTYVETGPPSRRSRLQRNIRPLV